MAVVLEANANSGPHTCIGRQLALGELRMAVARVVRVYRVEVGEGYDEEKYRREFKDHATAMIGEIQVRFIPRE
jgi:cytochrome P450